MKMTDWTIENYNNNCVAMNVLCIMTQKHILLWYPSELERRQFLAHTCVFRYFVEMEILNENEKRIEKKTTIRTMDSRTHNKWMDKEH